MLTSKHVEFIHQQLGVFGTSWYTMGGAKKWALRKRRGEPLLQTSALSPCLQVLCFPVLSQSRIRCNQKNHHELLVSIYEHCYVNWYVNCFVNCGVSVSPHTSQRSCYTVLK
jgi:hypothetical protein